MSKVIRKPAGKSAPSMMRDSTRIAKRVTSTTNVSQTLPSAATGQRPKSAIGFAQPASVSRGRPRQHAAPGARAPITFVRLAALSPEAREQAVRAGLSPALLDEAAVKVGLSQRALLAAMKMAPTTVARSRAKGSPLSLDDSDRLARLAELWQGAMTVFEHEEGARGWLTGRVPVLDAVPLQLVQTSQGFNRARTAVLQLAYGVYA